MSNNIFPWNFTMGEDQDIRFLGPSNMPQLLAILAMMQRGLAQNVKDAFSQAGKAITKEIADVKNPIVGGISYIGSSQCSNVKKLIGVDYEQVDGVSEPDLHNLTLNFICPELRVQFALGSVARTLPSTRGYDPKSKLVLFMHGFTDNPDKTNFQTVNEAFQSIGHYNILALDASPLIRWLYLRSSTYVRFIGEKLGETLAAMAHNGLEPRNIHLIGHSLGAHISAFAGKRFTELTGFKVGRLSALDPAGPCFSHVDENLRLNSTDAEFVDAIHTDAGVYGITDPVAQADYFPNGGSQQPNCFLESCSHSRAVELFAESVSRRDAFPALRCQDYEAFKKGQCYGEVSLMGLAATPGTPGQYYLQTNEKEPYGAYKAGMKYVNRDGVVKSIGNFFG